jgi:hypothetical protein
MRRLRWILFNSAFELWKKPVGSTSACTKCETSDGPRESVPGQFVTWA